MRKIAIVAIVLLSSLAARAGDGPADADAHLNESYKALMSRLAPADQQRLRDAQRAWIAFRDKECSFRAQGSERASASALANARCIATLDQERADALRHQLECPQG